MGLEDIKRLITESGGDNPSYSYDFINTAIESERKKGIEEVSKRNKEAERLKVFKSAVINNLGFNPDGQENINDFTTKIKSSFEELEGARSKAGGLEGRLNTLEANLKVERDKNKVAEQKVLDSQNAQKISTIKSTLLKSLDSKIYSADSNVDQLIAQNKVGIMDDGKTVFFKNGDAEVDYSIGLDSYLDKNKEIRKDEQSAGSGSFDSRDKSRELSKELKEFAEETAISNSR